MRIERKQIEELRNLTGMGVMECTRTLEDVQGDLAKALVILDEKAKEIARQKAEREVKTGLVDSYIHGDGRIGVMIEVVCETDFLSKSRDFRTLIKDLMLQIAAENPQYVSIDEVPVEILRDLEEEAALSARALGKPERVISYIQAGKVKKYLSRACLMEQRFIKDQDITVGGLVRRFIAKSGENMKVLHFTRYQSY
jgi:elongation factor Ts